MTTRITALVLLAVGVLLLAWVVSAWVELGAVSIEGRL